MSVVLAQHPIIGSWRLLSWRICNSDGRITYPFGGGAHGQLIYSVTGRMLTCVATANRADLSTFVPKAASSCEKAAAFDGYFSYGGSFELDGKDVLHYVHMALNPNFVGTVQRRHMSFADNRLTLSASESRESGERYHELVWESS